MAGFNPDDYVDVAQRIQDFKKEYPNGRLRGEGEFVRNAAGEIIGYHYVAYAHTSFDDELPAIGTAYEPIPGRTTFTKDSEVMNAETSAWGRAIVALGFPTKKIASADEVRNRRGAEPASSVKADPPAGDAETLTKQLLEAGEKLGVLEATVQYIETNKKGQTEAEHVTWLGEELVKAQADLKAKATA